MSIFKYLKSQLSIVNVIKDFCPGRVHLESEIAGAYYSGECPFHTQEKGRWPLLGTFFVSPYGNSFHCFECHASGDVIDFVAKLNNYTHLEAADALIERYSLPLPCDLQTGMCAGMVAREIPEGFEGAKNTAGCTFMMSKECAARIDAFLKGETPQEPEYEFFSHEYMWIEEDTKTPTGQSIKKLVLIRVPEPKKDESRNEDKA